AHLRPGPVAADDIAGPDRAFLTGALAGGVANGDGDRMISRRTLGAVDGEVDELDAVVGSDPTRRLDGELGEVVEHAGLVDDEVRELADPVLVVLGPTGADDVLGIVRVRIPKRHLRDVVALAHDLFGEAERLKSLDGTSLDAIGLTDDQTGVALLDHPSVYVRVLRELGGRDHSGRSAADDEDVDLIGQVLVAIDAVPGGLLDPRVSGHIAVLMEMHVNLRFVTRRRDAQILTVHIRSGSFGVVPVTAARSSPTRRRRSPMPRLRTGLR